MKWLKGELEKTNPETPIVLVCHMPLITSFYQATAGQGKVGPPNRVVTNNLEVLEAFAKHRLHLVLQGHLHVNEICGGGTPPSSPGERCPASGGGESISGRGRVLAW